MPAPYAKESAQKSVAPAKAGAQEINFLNKSQNLKHSPDPRIRGRAPAAYSLRVEAGVGAIACKTSCVGARHASPVANSGPASSWRYTLGSFFAMDKAMHPPAFALTAYLVLLTGIASADGLKILGERLFHDKRLSADGSISCASCHIPDKAFTDGLPLAKGINGQLGTRNTPSLINVKTVRPLFWDGRRDTLEAQAKDPFVNPREHGFTQPAQVADLVRSAPIYTAAFQKSFSISPEAISIDHIAQALAEFERTLVAYDSPAERYLYRGDKNALTESARRGLALFRGRARCSSCHLIGETQAPLTDNAFHSLGIGYKKIEPRLAEITTRLANSRGKPLDHSVISDQEISELGRFVVTLNPTDIAKFRTPSLHNVALTAPYMHDGSVTTLEEVVELELYYRGAETGRPLALTLPEREDLLAFLRALNTNLMFQSP